MFTHIFLTIGQLVKKWHQFFEIQDLTKYGYLKIATCGLADET